MVKPLNQPNISGKKIAFPLDINLSCHQPKSWAPHREPIMKKIRAISWVRKPSPVLMRIPDAQPPAITIPIPNRIPPIMVARLIGFTEIIPGISSPFMKAPYLIAVKPMEVIAKAMRRALVREVPLIR